MESKGMLLLYGLLFGCVNGLLYVPLPIYVMKETSSLFLVGLISSLPFFALFSMSFVWGAVSDKMGTRKEILVYASLLHGVLYFPMPFMDIMGLIALRFFQVIFQSSSVLATALITEYMPERKGEAVGTLSFYTSVGWLIGGMAGGFVYMSGMMASVFMISGVVALLSGIVLVNIEERRKVSEIPSIMDIMKFGTDRRMVLIVCTVNMLAFFSNYMVFTVFPVYMKDVLGVSEGIIGVIGAAAGITGAAVIGAVSRYIDRRGRRPMFVLSVMVYMLDWFIMAFTGRIEVIVAIWLVPSWIFITLSSTAIISDITREEERGRGLGALSSMLNLGAFLGSISSGIVGELMAPTDLGSYRGIFLVSGILLVIPFIIALKSRETLPATPGTQHS